MTERVCYRRRIGYQPAQPAKTAYWAVFATKMRQISSTGNGLAGWDQPKLFVRAGPAGLESTTELIFNNMQGSG